MKEDLMTADGVAMSESADDETARTGRAAVERALAAPLTLTGLQAGLDSAIEHAAGVLDNVMTTGELLDGIRRPRPLLSEEPDPIGQLSGIARQIEDLREQLAYIDDANAHVQRLLGAMTPRGGAARRRT